MLHLRIRHQAQFRQREIRLRGDQLEGAEQPVGDRVDVVIAQDSREILEFEPQSPVCRRGNDREWIVRGILGVVDVENVHSGYVGAGGESTAVDGIRLEHSQRVERCSGPHSRSDVRKPDMMVIGQPRLFRLDANAQRRQGLSWIEANSDGDGVDEQTHHRLDAGHLGWSAGDGSTEDDVVAAEEFGEHDSPGHLDQGGCRQATGADESTQKFRLTFSERCGRRA